MPDPTPSPVAVLRKASDHDANAVAEIWRAGWRDGHLGYVPQELVEARSATSFYERSTQRIADTDHTVVAVLGETVVGFTMVVDDEVEQVYVDSGARGSGVAGLLLDNAEATVLANGHHLTWLAVVAGNDRARAFYAKQGWTDAGAFDYLAHGPSGPLVVPSHRYEKKLG